MSDSKEDFYEPALCPNCNVALDIKRSKEEWGTEVYLSCNRCEYEDCNLIR